MEDKPVLFNKDTPDEFWADTVADFGNEDRPDVVKRLSHLGDGVIVGKLAPSEERPKAGDTAHLQGDPSTWDVIGVYEDRQIGMQTAPGKLFAMKLRGDVEAEIDSETAPTPNSQV